MPPIHQPNQDGPKAAAYHAATRHDPLLGVLFGPNLHIVGRDVIRRATADGRLEVVAHVRAGPEHAEVDQMIKVLQTYFKPTAMQPSPGDFIATRRKLNPNLIGDGVIDLIGVLAGVKPAALLCPRDIYSDPHGREALQRAFESGLSIASCRDSAGLTVLLVGAEKNVLELATVFKNNKSLPDAEVDTRIGRALGYPEEAIQRKLRGDIPREVVTVGYLLKLVAIRGLIVPVLKVGGALYGIYLRIRLRSRD